MYNDYPTVYETVINNNIIYITVLSVLIVLILLFTLFSLAKIYKKANRSAISAWIPIYNILVLLEIVNLPKWYLILLLIPILNIYIGIKVFFNLTTLFRKSKLFALGMLFLPFIFYPILAFGSSEYFGINLMAVGGKTQAVDIPVVIDDEDKNPVIHEEEDIKSKNIGISIGGGVYQKDYTNNLLEVDKNQEIIKKVDLNNSATMKKQSLNFSKASFITQIPEEPVEDEMQEKIGINFPNPFTHEQNGVESFTSDSINQIYKSTNLNNNIINNDNISHVANNVVSNQENSNIKVSNFKICPKCSAKLKNDVNICFLCGTKLN